MWRKGGCSYINIKINKCSNDNQEGIVCSSNEEIDEWLFDKKFSISVMDTDLDQSNSTKGFHEHVSWL